MVDLDEQWQIRPWCVFRWAAVACWAVALALVLLGLAKGPSMIGLVVLASASGATLTVLAFAAWQLPNIARRIAVALDSEPPVRSIR